MWKRSQFWCYSQFWHWHQFQYLLDLALALELSSVSESVPDAPLMSRSSLVLALAYPEAVPSTMYCTTTLVKITEYMYCLVKEAVEVWLHPSYFNRNAGFTCKLVLEPGCRNTLTKQSCKQPLGYMEGTVNTCCHPRFSMLNNIDCAPNSVGWFCLVFTCLCVLGQGHWTWRANYIHTHACAHTHMQQQHYSSQPWMMEAKTVSKTEIVSYRHGWLLKKS
jgi:hypothetical protein